MTMRTVVVDKIGSVTQALTMQGSTTTVTANSGGAATSLTFQAPTANVTYRLLTTITDPDAAPAWELAELYFQRWEIESAFGELKTHQRGPGVVLRSKLPDGVLQEVYGYLCVHYAIRWLMHSVATDSGRDPDRLSFTRSLRAARRTTASHPGFSP